MLLIAAYVLADIGDRFKSYDVIKRVSLENVAFQCFCSIMNRAFLLPLVKFNKKFSNHVYQYSKTFIILEGLIVFLETLNFSLLIKLQYHTSKYFPFFVMR